MRDETNVNGAAQEFADSIRAFIDATVRVGNADVDAVSELNHSAELYVRHVTERTAEVRKLADESKKRLWETRVAVETAKQVGDRAKQLETTVDQLEAYLAALEERLRRGGKK